MTRRYEHEDEFGFSISPDSLADAMAEMEASGNVAGLNILKRVMHNSCPQSELPLPSPEMFLEAVEHFMTPLDLAAPISRTLSAEDETFLKECGIAP